MTPTLPEPPAKKRLLTDVGTRLDHWQELLDMWNDGLIAVTNSLKRFSNDTDVARKRSLENAIYLVNKQIEQLGDFDKVMPSYRTQINSIPPTGWNKKPISRLMEERIEEQSKKGGPDDEHNEST